MKIFFAILTVLTMFIGVDCSGKAVKLADLWTVPADASAKEAFVYLIIKNSTDAPDVITALSTPKATKAELVQEKTDNGLTDIQVLAKYSVPANKDTLLKAHQLYVRLSGLTEPLKQGDKFPLTVTFDKAGDITENVLVEAAGSMMYEK